MKTPTRNAPMSSADKHKLARERKKAAGLVRMTETWIHPDDKPAIAEFMRGLNEARGITAPRKNNGPA